MKKIIAFVIVLGLIGNITMSLSLDMKNQNVIQEGKYMTSTNIIVQPDSDDDAGIRK